MGAMPESLTVALDGRRDYPIYFGADLIGDASVLVPHLSSSAFIVTNERVARLYLDDLQSALPPSVRREVFRMGDGEAFKTLDTYAAIMDRLIATRYGRTTTVIALGGGIVGDVAGFVAATYQRGVGFIQVPTTLLAQVDSSVGGKTAINHPLGKNLVGAFHQPGAVIADMGVLRSLPEREYRAGLAEVIKYGIIADAAFFDWIEANMAQLLSRDADALTFAVRRSCEIKADVVGRDEREQGVRAHLNFGHTFGHAIERLTGFEAYLHGEAVAIGMVMAMDLSTHLEQASKQEFERVKQLLTAAGLPVAARGIDAAAMLDAMGLDKKAVDGRIRFILNRGLGVVEVVDDAPRDLVVRAIEGTMQAA